MKRTAAHSTALTLRGRLLNPDNDGQHYCTASTFVSTSSRAHHGLRQKAFMSEICRTARHKRTSLPAVCAIAIVVIPLIPIKNQIRCSLIPSWLPSPCSP